MCSQIPRLAIACGHPRFKSIASQNGSTILAACSKVSGSLPQNCNKTDDEIITLSLPLLHRK